MGKITIVDVKIVGLCSKHRNSGEGFDGVLRDKNGRIYEDKEIECLECDL